MFCMSGDVSSDDFVQEEEDSTLEGEDVSPFIKVIHCCLKLSSESNKETFRCASSCVNIEEPRASVYVSEFRYMCFALDENKFSQPLAF